MKVALTEADVICFNTWREGVAAAAAGILRLIVLFQHSLYISINKPSL